jgi:hypothetical protein
MSARIITVLVGTWLFLSAFAWPHATGQGMATLMAGMLTVLSALTSIYYPRFRYVTAAIALALFVASLATATRYDRTVWHNTVIAVAVFVLALMDRGTPRERGHLRAEQDELSRPVSDPHQSRI